MAAKTTKTKRQASSSASRSGTKRKPSYRPSSKNRSTGQQANRSTSKKRRSKKGRTMKGRTLLTLLVVAVLMFAFWNLFIRPELNRPTYGVEAYHVRIPDGYSVHGIDVSHHQGDIDWEKLSALQQADIPIRFVFIKATEGGDHEDRRFDENFAAAREQGFVRGAYHFYNPATDPVVQADFFISHVPLEKGDLPPVIDVEKAPSRLQQQSFYAQLSVFLYRLEAHYGVRPLIYTSYKFKERYLDVPELERYPLWIAHYHVPQPGYQGEWAFWQHTDRAVLPGIDEKTDLNVFRGTMKDLQSITLP